MNDVLPVTIDGKNYNLKISGRNLEEIENLVTRLNEEISSLKKNLSGKNISYENLLIMVCLKILETKKNAPIKSTEQVDLKLKNILEILSSD